MTDRTEIKAWLENAKSEGATHMLVVVDTYDHDDYPVNVAPEDDVRDIYNRYNDKNMQRVMEVYNISLDFETQLNQYHAFNF